MKIQVITEKENPLMKRREVIINLDYDGKSTPSKAELQKLLSEELKVNIDTIEITKLLSEIGMSKGKAWIKVWKEKKIPIYSEIKKEKPAEAPKEQKVEEKPKTEASEEAK